MRLKLIMNPSSRSGHGRRRWDEWEKELKSRDVEYEAVVSRSADELISAARSASRCDAVVAVGGDGTINRVIDGALQSDRQNMQVGVLYAGTSPDFCRFHKIPIDPRHSVEALLSESACQVDVVRAAFETGLGSKRISHFASSCNIGLGAAIASFANRVRRYLGDRLGTAMAALLAIARCGRLDLKVDVGGGEKSLHAVNHLLIAKNPYIASGLKVQLPLKPDDGQMAAVLVHGLGRRGILSALPAFYSGRILACPGIAVTSVSRVSVRCESSVPLEFDGDERGRLPLTVELLPRALHLLGCRHE